MSGQLGAEEVSWLLLLINQGLACQGVWVKAPYLGCYLLLSRVSMLRLSLIHGEHSSWLYYIQPAEFDAGRGILGLNGGLDEKVIDVVVVYDVRHHGGSSALVFIRVRLV